jgi:hypothetical protein
MTKTSAKTSLVDADSLLAVEVGSVNTRALLFDTVEGSYRFLASGAAGTTAGAPMHDASEGVRHAIDRLQAISGRKVIGSNEGLIMPSNDNGSGIDRFVTTLSAGPPLKVVTVGLLEDVSLQSVNRLVSAVKSRIVETLSLNDNRRPEEQVDTILRLRPDVVIIAGGTDNGATRSVINLVNTLGMALELLPSNVKPHVIYAGNQELAQRVKEHIEPLAPISISPNVRPNLNYEQLAPAESILAGIYRNVYNDKILGIAELTKWAKGHLYPTSTAFGRVVRFYSKVYDPSRGVLGIDVGASSTTVASSFNGDLKLKVYPSLGLGEGISGMLKQMKLEKITRWIPLEVSDEYVINYLYNKSLHPLTLPATTIDLAIEQAVARQAMRAAMKDASLYFPKDIAGPSSGEGLPYFEPILVSGSVLAKAPTLAQSLLMVLDGLEPTGMTTILLDKNNIAPALGAAAGVNSTLAVQVLFSNAFIKLGTVIVPDGKARNGTPVVRIKITYDDGQDKTLEVRYGSLQVISLPVGRSAELRIQPLHRFDVGMGGPGRGGVRKVTGGPFGIVVDARGRPLRIPASPKRRLETLQRWHLSLGSRT